MHHPHDQWFKALMEACWELVAEVELERAVHVPPQRIDLAFEPRARSPELGIVDRMAAQGPGMLEYFSGAPTDADIKACVRKRLNYDHERGLAAKRRGDVMPPDPRLWILSASTLRASAAAHLVCMEDWPMGFWQARTDEQVHFVVLNELPETPETLPLRLLGRGQTLQRGLADLSKLSRDHLLNMRARPVLIAFRPNIMQDLEKTGDMTAFQRAQALYQEWEQSIREDEARRIREDEAREAQRIREDEAREAQRIREDEARELLVHLVSQRFGEMPDHIAAHIQRADHATLRRWAMQVLTARSLDDVIQ